MFHKERFWEIRMLKKWGIATLAMMLVVLIVWMVSNQGKVTAGGEDAKDNNIETSDESTETVSDNDETADEASEKEEEVQQSTNVVNRDETIIMIPVQGTLDTLITDSIDDVLEEEKEIIICASPSAIADVPVVSGHAVVFMDGAGATIHQGDVDEEELKELQEKLQVKDSLDETQLSAWDFYRMNSLTEYEVPDGVTEINRFAFARSGLREIVIPEGVTDIRYAAFYHCDNLEKVTIPSTVTNIEKHAFDHTPWLKDFYENSEEEFLIVGDGILLAYKGTDTDVEIPENVKVIASDAFSGGY